MALALFVSLPAVAQTRELTPAHVRTLLSSAGINPGMVRTIEGFGRYTLRSMSVSGGHGDYLIHLHVEPVR